ncbi:DUF5685 family protein [Plantactinospora sonchi]|uniref:DUF5685 family protein n=1 Tax=Plantactinospora sonchi TaxID=1544735 RepID=A0ABU7RQR5_9ACTN
MFGIVRPCRHRMCGKLHDAWLGHLCGLCLTLRDEHGHRARLTTNYDGLLVSVLLEAQRTAPVGYRRAAPCALRGFRSADVLPSADPGARLAAAVSLVLAAGKTRDHVSDRDGALRIPAIAAVADRLADGWAGAGARTAGKVGFDTGTLVEAVARQATLERELRPGVPVLLATEPAETAVAAAFAHTAVLAGVPGNADALAEAGRFFGRIAHLLDAVEDHADDVARNVFNPLHATGTDLAEARRLCEDAHEGLRLALADAVLPNRSLARALLVREVGHAIDRTFALAADSRPAVPVAGPDWSTIPPSSPDQPGHPVSNPTGHPTGPPPARRPEGCTAPLVVGGACALVTCTCGLWQPPWSKHRKSGCDDRCWCTRNCDCCSCNCDCDCCGCDC